MKRLLEEKRPMEVNRNSALGLMEAVLVGIFRAPQLILRVLDRVKELLQSEILSMEDIERSYVIATV